MLLVLWGASVWDCVAHFTGHASQTGGYGNSWHWTGKDWRLSSVHILFTDVIKWSYSILSLSCILHSIKFTSCSCSVISWRGWKTTTLKMWSYVIHLIHDTSAMSMYVPKKRNIVTPNQHEQQWMPEKCTEEGKSSFVTARGQWPACWVSAGGWWGWRWRGWDCSSSVSYSPSFKLKYCPP